jgi:ABC-type lipoprotein release transport system permease subunit
MNNFKMAWRNLWRNRRRTLITVASVFFAVFFALIMRSLQLGTYNHMFRNVIESYTGYLQVQHEDFWDNKVIENTFAYTPELENTVAGTENVVSTVPRFESFALASSGQLTKGVLVMGIDPEKEKFLSDVKSKLLNSGDSAGNGYLSLGEKGLLAGEKLAAYLKISPGDTIVLLGQGYHGTTAAGKFRVNGIVRLPSPDLDNKIVYLPYDACQELYNAPGMLTSLAISIKNNDDETISGMIGSLGAQIDPPLRVIGWREMNKLMINQMDADSKSGMIMILILYLVIAFGIFGTVLMMTAERRREFGVLVAIGMQKSKLISIVTLEMIYIGILGIGSGIAAAWPVIIYGFYHPIRFTGEFAKMYEDYGMEPVMPFLPADWYFLWQSIAVSVIVAIAIVYPIRKISKMHVVNSLKA